MISGFGGIPNPIWPGDDHRRGWGDSMPNKVIYGAPANSGQREHLDYDQIEFKIRSKTVKETVQNKNVLTI